jgi:hypothetical protein
MATMRFQQPAGHSPRFALRQRHHGVARDPWSDAGRTALTGAESARQTICAAEIMPVEADRAAREEHENIWLDRLEEPGTKSNG